MSALMNVVSRWLPLMAYLLRSYRHIADGEADIAILAVSEYVTFDVAYIGASVPILHCWSPRRTGQHGPGGWLIQI